MSPSSRSGVLAVLTAMAAVDVATAFLVQGPVSAGSIPARPLSLRTAKSESFFATRKSPNADRGIHTSFHSFHATSMRSKTSNLMMAESGQNEGEQMKFASGLSVGFDSVVGGLDDAIERCQVSSALHASDMHGTNMTRGDARNNSRVLLPLIWQPSSFQHGTWKRAAVRNQAKRTGCLKSLKTSRRSRSPSPIYPVNSATCPRVSAYARARTSPVLTGLYRASRRRNQAFSHQDGGSPQRGCAAGTGIAYGANSRRSY
eukprot:2708050-Rhodomonas_salina.1